MDTFTDDDLEQAFAQQATKVAAHSAAAAALSTDEDMPDAGDEKYVSAPRQGFIKPAKFGEVVRLALLDPKEFPGLWKQAITHARKGFGVIRCLDSKGKGTAACCKSLGDAKLGYYTVAVHYVNADSKKGTFAKGVTPEIELVPLKLSPYAYGDVRNLINDETEGETIFSFDLIMGMESEQVVQGYNWKRSTTAPKYRELGADAVKSLLNPWADGTRLSKAIAKTVNLVELQAALSKLPSDSE